MHCLVKRSFDWRPANYCWKIMEQTQRTVKKLPTQGGSLSNYSQQHRARPRHHVRKERIAELHLTKENASLEFEASVPVSNTIQSDTSLLTERTFASASMKAETKRAVADVMKLKSVLYFQLSRSCLSCLANITSILLCCLCCVCVFVDL